MTTAELAKQIRTEGENWQDAMKRDSAILKAEKAATAPEAPKAPEVKAEAATEAPQPATAPVKDDGKWKVAHNGVMKEFATRHDASRYYRENREKATVKTAEAKPEAKKPKAKSDKKAEAPFKKEGKWCVKHGEKVLPFATRYKAARYYRANR